MYENIASASINTAVNGIELSFDKKPDYAVLKDLKENGFRWHNKKQIWYGRNTAANVRAVEKYVDLEASDAVRYACGVWGYDASEYLEEQEEEEALAAPAPLAEQIEQSAALAGDREFGEVSIDKGAR